jgi:hypothetical protein
MDASNEFTKTSLHSWILSEFSVISPMLRAALNPVSLSSLVVMNDAVCFPRLHLYMCIVTRLVSLGLLWRFLYHVSLLLRSIPLFIIFESYDNLFVRRLPFWTLEASIESLDHRLNNFFRLATCQRNLL